MFEIMQPPSRLLLAAQSPLSDLFLFAVEAGPT